MRSSARYLPLFAFGLFLCACDNSPQKPEGGATAKPAATEDIGETLAMVNGNPIGTKEFEKAAARTMPKEGDSLSPAEKTEVLDKLVADKLLYQEALKKGLDKDPKVQKVMINTLLREDVYSQVRNSDFSEDVLKAYYEAHPEEFVVPEKVQIKKILVKVSDERPEAQAKAMAEKARAEVAGNPKDTFKDVAAKYSEDTYRRRGGDVGFVAADGKAGLDPDIVKKAFAMPTNTVSEIFKTSEGYNIIYVANRREKVERTFQQMKGSVLRKVKNDKVKELYDGYVAKLKGAAKIDVKEDKLASTEVKHVARPSLPPGTEMGAGVPLMPEGHDNEMEGEEPSGAEENLE
jgi:peptidyl-prolyl cis-trans isomerase C